MASTFKTSSGSVYTFDVENRVITGGIFGKNSVAYIPEKTQIIEKDSALIYLEDGRVLSTSTVENIM